MQQIRLTKTAELEKVLFFLRRRYRLLSEAEIIKLALSEKYHRDIKPVKEEDVKQLFKKITAEGRKLGDKFLKSKGLKREDVTEEEFYHLLKND